MWDTQRVLRLPLFSNIFLIFLINYSMTSMIGQIRSPVSILPKEVQTPQSNQYLKLSSNRGEKTEKNNLLVINICNLKYRENIFALN